MVDFTISPPATIDSAALDLMIANLDVDQSVAIEYSLTGTSGSASTEANSSRLVWNLPAGYGVKITQIMSLFQCNLTSRVLSSHIHVCQDIGTIVCDQFGIPNRLFSQKIIRPVSVEVNDKPIFTNFGKGFKLVKNQLDVSVTFGFGDTVAATPEQAATVQINYQIYKRTEKEYADLIASSVQ